MIDFELWKFILAVSTSVVGAAWAAFVYFDRRRHGTENTSSTGDILLITLLPTGAVVMVLAGLALAAWAIVAGSGQTSVSGDVATHGSSVTTIDVSNGVGVGGHIEDSTVEVSSGDWRKAYRIAKTGEVSVVRWFGTGAPDRERRIWPIAVVS